MTITALTSNLLPVGPVLSILKRAILPCSLPTRLVSGKGAKRVWSEPSTAVGRYWRRDRDANSRSPQQTTLSRSSSFPKPAFLFRLEIATRSQEGPAVRIPFAPAVGPFQRSAADAPSKLCWIQLLLRRRIGNHLRQAALPPGVTMTPVEIDCPLSKTAIQIFSGGDAG